VCLFITLHRLVISRKHSRTTFALTTLSPYLGLIGIRRKKICSYNTLSCVLAFLCGSGFDQDFPRSRAISVWQIYLPIQTCIKSVSTTQPKQHLRALRPLNCKISFGKRSGTIKFSCGFLSAKALFFCRKKRGEKPRS
jgi:hypothetical protein